MEQKTMSYAQGKGNINHNERRIDGSTKIRSCGDITRRDWNIVIESHDLKETYKSIFGEAMAQYNEEQIRKNHAERCKSIDGYIDSLVKASGGKGGKKRPLPFNEVVIQFGNHLDGCPYEFCKNKNGKMLDENGKVIEPWETDRYPAKVLDKNGNPIMSEEGKKLKALLLDYYDIWKKENPRLVILGAYIHMDEKAGPHLHIDYIATAKSNRGMSLKVAKTAALEQQLTEQGIDYKNENGKTDRNHNAVKTWTKRMREIGVDLAKRHNIEIVSTKGAKRNKHSSREYGELKDDMLAKFRQSVQDAALEIEMPKTDGYFRVSTYHKEVVVPLLNDIAREFGQLKAITDVLKEEDMERQARYEASMKEIEIKNKLLEEAIQRTNDLDRQNEAKKAIAEAKKSIDVMRKQIRKEYEKKEREMTARAKREAESFVREEVRVLQRENHELSKKRVDLSNENMELKKKLDEERATKQAYADNYVSLISDVKAFFKNCVPQNDVVRKHALDYLGNYSELENEVGLVITNTSPGRSNNIDLNK